MPNPLPAQRGPRSGCLWRCPSASIHPRGCSSRSSRGGGELILLCCPGSSTSTLQGTAPQSRVPPRPSIAARGSPSRLGPSPKVAFPVPGSARPSPVPQGFVAARRKKQAVPGGLAVQLEKTKGEKGIVLGARRGPGCSSRSLAPSRVFSRRRRIRWFWRGEGSPPAAPVAGTAQHRGNLAPSP